MNDKMLSRLTWFLAELKANRYPNARTLARHMRQKQEEESFSRKSLPPVATSEKTAQRDIRYLIDRLNAPLEYCADRRGYRLVSETWQFKGMILDKETLFTALLCCQISKPMLPPSLSDEVDEVRNIQLAASEPGNLDLKIFESVVVASGLHVPLAEKTTSIILEAWMNCHCLRMQYQSLAEIEPEQREIDIHALFLADGVWYARACCHQRQAMRTFALHRIRNPIVLEQKFIRDAAIVESVRNGKFFDRPVCVDVRARVARERAIYVLERAWFPGQTAEKQEDGSVILHFPSAGQEELILWVLSFRGQIQLLAPADIRNVLHHYGQALADGHA
jgi:predicted DNA-binding transcriptional regulator YafY